MKKKLFLALKLALVGIVGYVAYNNVNVTELFATLGRADIRLIGLSLLLLVPNLALEAIKWQFVVRPFKPSFSFHDALASTLIGFSASFITPARAGDFAAKVFYLRPTRPNDEPIGTVAASVLNFFNGFTIMIATTTAGVLAIAAFFVQRGELTVAWLCGGSLILFWLVMSCYRWILRWKILQKVGSLQLLLRYTAREMTMIMIYATARYGVFVVQFYLLFAALADIDVAAAMITITATLFIKSAIPFYFGDLFIRAMSSGFFLKAFGYPEAIAIDASALSFVITNVLPSVLGTAFFHKLKLTPDA